MQGKHRTCVRQSQEESEDADRRGRQFCERCQGQLCSFSTYLQCMDCRPAFLYADIDVQLRVAVVGCLGNFRLTRGHCTSTAGTSCRSSKESGPAWYVRVVVLCFGFRTLGLLFTCFLCDFLCCSSLFAPYFLLFVDWKCVG